VSADELLTDRLALRPMRPGDVPAFAAYRRDPDVARWQSWGTDYSDADGERLVAAQAGAGLAEPGRWVQVAVLDRSTGELCGDCAVHLDEGPPRTAEVGVTFAPESQGRGLATEALRAFVTHLFSELDAHRVIAQADDRNEPVHRLLERLGFRCEARHVDAEWFKGDWCTMRTYAVLRREWSSRA
jgi:RimJ/RimL family protein N-acetyltransferase